jgi:hypothetical protein
MFLPRYRPQSLNQHLSIAAQTLIAFQYHNQYPKINISVFLYRKSPTWFDDKTGLMTADSGFGNQ